MGRPCRKDSGGYGICGPEFWSVTESMVGMALPSATSEYGIRQLGGDPNDPNFESLKYWPPDIRGKFYRFLTGGGRLQYDKKGRPIPKPKPFGPIGPALNRMVVDFIRERDEDEPKVEYAPLDIGPKPFIKAICRKTARWVKNGLPEKDDGFSDEYRQDATQETLIAFIQERQSGTTIDKVYGWLKGVAKHKCGDEIRKREKERDGKDPKTKKNKWPRRFYDPDPKRVGKIQYVRALYSDDDEERDVFLENLNCLKVSVVTDSMFYGQRPDTLIDKLELFDGPLYKGAQTEIIDESLCKDGQAERRRKDLDGGALNALGHRRYWLYAWHNGGRAWLHEIQKDLVSGLFVPPTRNQAKKALELAWRDFDRRLRALGYKKIRFRLPLFGKKKEHESYF